MTSEFITPVILSGGAGTRLWPLSRRELPKQMLNLVGQRSMFRETLDRVTGQGFAAPVVICAYDHRFLIAEELRSAGVEGARIVLEPVGRGTAPAAAIAALLVAVGNSRGLVLLTPSDHVVADKSAFTAALGVAMRTAKAGALAIFGVTPTVPETGYGYIRAAESMDDIPGAYRVAQFVEKPNRASAERYLADGGYSWNSGMLVFRADVMLGELERLEPTVLRACRSALNQARHELNFIRMDERVFREMPVRSIDHAVMERTTNAVVVPVSMGWSDVGSWQSLWEIARRTADENVLVGNVISEQVRGCYLRSEGPLVAAVGVEDLVVVAARDAFLVCRRGTTQDVRKIVEELERLGSNLHVSNPIVTRPWGSYENVDAGPGFLVKRILVNPGGRLSLQMHRHRAEHWLVVSGTALVTCEEEQFTLQVNEATHIPLGAIHRLENVSELPLLLIEVQIGTILSEDDIVRLDDIYGRSVEAKSPQ